MATLSLSCQCGKVKGHAQVDAPKQGNRIACYCKDCRAFAQHLKQDKLLDEWGGTEIYQMPLSHMVIEQGQDQIRCLRIGKDGLHRWYTACCHTPLGNTLGSGMPFIGLIHGIYDADPGKEQTLGKLMGGVHRKSATQRIPENQPSAHSPSWIMPYILIKLLWWKLTGKAKPSVLFNDKGEPLAEPEIVSKQ